MGFGLGSVDGAWERLRSGGVGSSGRQVGDRFSSREVHQGRQDRESTVNLEVSQPLIAKSRLSPLRAARRDGLRLLWRGVTVDHQRSC